MIVQVVRRSWLFSKGLPATCPLVPCNGRRVVPLCETQALPDVRQAGRQAGDLSKKIEPILQWPHMWRLPLKSTESLGLAHPNPTYVATLPGANRYRLEEIGMTE